MKPVFMSSCTILYIDFTANVAGATVEMFFAELIAFSDTDISVSLCKSKGPIDSFSVITMFSILKMEASYVAGMLYNTVQDIMRHKYDQHNS
ncbi:hypothetical protein ACET3Z_019618 [Daucus carota]